MREAPYAGICGTGFAHPVELARYRYRIPMRSVCEGAAQHLRVAQIVDGPQIVDGRNWLLNAIEDVRFVATTMRSKPMAQGLSNCIRAVGAMLVAGPLAVAPAPPRNFILLRTPAPGAGVRLLDAQSRPRRLPRLPRQLGPSKV